MKLVSSVALSAAVFAAVNSASKAAILYDSHGFETPFGFTPGSLAGQSATNAPVWQFATTQANAAGASSITVENTFAQSGTQAVKFTRALGDLDTYTAPVFNVTPSQRYLDISYNMYMASGATLDPFFGLFAYNYPNPIGYAGIDGTTGQVVYSQASTGNMLTSSTTVPLNSWNTFTLQLDYTTQTETFFVGSTAVASAGFFVTGQTGFTDADIASFASNGTQTATGTAYFDNYQIYSSTSAVPEPAIGSLLLLGSSGTLLRRRRAR